MLAWLNAQKTHIIYIIIILGVASVAYHFFNKPPEKVTQVVTKTVTKTQVITKVVTKDRLVYVDKTITTKKANGDVITETDHEHSDTKTDTDLKQTKALTSNSTSTTITSYQKPYSLGVLVPFNPLSPASVPNLLDSQVDFGVRILDSDWFAVVSTDPKFNKIMVGLRVEF